MIIKKAIYNNFVFRVSRNFLRISRKFRTTFNFVFREIFAKLLKNFAKREIDNFAKFSQKHKNQNFRSHPSHPLLLHPSSFKLLFWFLYLTVLGLKYYYVYKVLNMNALN